MKPTSLLLFFNERLRSIRFLVLVSVFGSIVLLGQFGGLFSYLLTVFQITVVPFGMVQKPKELD
jgi:hypothetical protein